MLHFLNIILFLLPAALLYSLQNSNCNGNGQNGKTEEDNAKDNTSESSKDESDGPSVRKRRSSDSRDKPNGTVTRDYTEEQAAGVNR